MASDCIRLEREIVADVVSKRNLGYSRLMWIIVVLLILLGLAIGSFLNVVIYRTVHDESFVAGRSRCPHCKKTIYWYDNIPVLSYLFLQGKCRQCKKSISMVYPVIESITAALFLWWFFIGFAFFRLTAHPFIVLQPVFWLCVGLLFIVVFFADLFYGIIPDLAVIGLTALGLIYRGILYYFHIMQPYDFFYTLIGASGAVLFFYTLWKLTKQKGIGLGDVKLAFPIGLIVGWPKLLASLLVSFILGSVVGLFFIAVGKKKFSSRIPFGPFLVIATVFVLIWGDQLIQWYMGLL